MSNEISKENVIDFEQRINQLFESRSCSTQEVIDVIKASDMDYRRNYFLLCALTYCYYKQKEYEKVIGIMEELNINYSKTCYLTRVVAACYSGLDNYQKAVELLEIIELQDDMTASEFLHIQSDLLIAYIELGRHEDVRELLDFALNYLNCDSEDIDEYLAFFKLEYCYEYDTDVYLKDIFEHLRHCSINQFTLDILFDADFLAVDFFENRDMYLEASQLLTCMKKQIESIDLEDFEKKDLVALCNDKIEGLNMITA